jgi:uncharacterized protein (TIGR02246 family)
MESTMLEQALTATDEQAVRGLYQQLMDGWNQGSATAFAEPMLEDVDFVPFDGVQLKGREAIVRFHGPLFKTHLRGSRLTGKVTGVRFLSPTVALMHARGDTLMRGQSQASPARHSIQTMVAVKGERGWRLAAFQNTRVRPIGQNVAGTIWWLVSDWLWKFVRPREQRSRE